MNIKKHIKLIHQIYYIPFMYTKLVKTKNIIAIAVINHKGNEFQLTSTFLLNRRTRFEPKNTTVIP